MGREPGIRGRMAELYDVFVDWEGRLGREMPGLIGCLGAAGARRVLDAGCGTGRHVQALLAAGFDAHGADVSEEMLAQACDLTQCPGRLHAWRLGDDPPASLSALAPFDAIVCLGNVWPQILSDADVAGTCAAFRSLVRAGAPILIGLKAVAVRRASGNPYMPLLKRVRAGEPLFFVRFLDFDVPPGGDGAPLCDFHMLVARGDSSVEEGEALVHRAGRMRVWSPADLERTFRAAGFADVRVSARLDDPDAPPSGEDVFVHVVSGSALARSNPLPEKDLGRRSAD